MDLRIHIGAVIEKDLGNVQMSFQRGKKQGGFAVLAASTHICATFKKEPYNVWVST
jgi:hypothetical protein